MFRTLPYSFSGGQFALNRRTLQPFTESDDTRFCNNTTDLLKMSMVMLETCRGFYCNIYCYRIKELCIKLVIETSLCSLLYFKFTRWLPSVYFTTADRDHSLPLQIMILLTRKTQIICLEL